MNYYHKTWKYFSPSLTSFLKGKSSLCKQHLIKTKTMVLSITKVSVGADTRFNNSNEIFNVNVNSVLSQDNNSDHHSTSASSQFEL